MRRIGLYLIVLPTFGSARRILWDNITIEGQKLLDMIPDELIESRNEQQMRLRMINGSIIQLLGSDSFDNTIVGCNSVGIVFSEMSLSDPRAYYLSRPILNANDGFCILNGTPRSHNHFYDMANIAKANQDEWFYDYQTLDETHHIPIEKIQKEIDMGEISYDLARQEYYCDWECGQVGSYYGNYIQDMILKHRITLIPYESQYPVNTAWDLGVHDATAIIFWQQIGTSIRIIDYLEATDRGLDWFSKQLDIKGYKYAHHVGPHDLKVREFGAPGAMSRLETDHNLGIDFIVAPSLSLEDGIEAVKTTFSRVWIDETKCSELIKHLELYRRVYDEEKKRYQEKPLHDRHSNGADAMRYLCISLALVSGSSTTPEELDRRYRSAMMGQELPSQFHDKNFYY